MAVSSRISALKVTERLVTGIGLGESHFREFKSAQDRSIELAKPRDVKLFCKDIAETLVAFANADGRELFVGVEDDGTVQLTAWETKAPSVLCHAPHNRRQRTNGVDRIITPFSRDSTGNGKPAPSTYLHKQLDVTPSASMR